jgi:hypothetical protein
LGVHALVIGNTGTGSFDLGVGAVLFVILVFLRKKGYHIIHSYVGISFAGSLFVYLLASGGVNNTGHLWYYTFPLFALFLQGTRIGLVFTLLILGCAIIIFIRSKTEDHGFTRG